MVSGRKIETEGKNYYGVAKGSNIGIYTDWAQCQKQVNRVSGNLYEGFAELDDCVNFMTTNSEISKSDIVVYTI